MCRLPILLCLVFFSNAGSSQDTSSVIDDHDVTRYVKEINSKVDYLDQRLDRLTRKAVTKARKYEAEINKRLANTDSIKAVGIIGGSDDQYKQLEQRLANTGSIQHLIPSFDTINTTLKFLNQGPQVASIARGLPVNVQKTLFKVNDLGTRLEKAELIRKFLNERKEYLKEQLHRLGFTKEIKKLSKQVDFYNGQLHEFKSLIRERRKAERKVIEFLSKSKPFQNFMQKNSMLASLFRFPFAPDDPASVASLAGLQTRFEVNNLIQQQIGSNGLTQFQQNMDDAQSRLQQLRQNVFRSANNSTNWEMPEGFKPNGQQGKAFMKRLEYGMNIQSRKAGNFFPRTTDLGLSIGYKLNDKSLIGVGASYKIGWGNGWRNINITHQGVGLRSFIDWKLKGSFWLSAGYEHNYLTLFKSIDELKDANAWQQSGLIGLSKVISLKTRFIKKARFQLLWDFLSYRQVPQTEPIIFRIGYGFK